MKTQPGQKRIYLSNEMEIAERRTVMVREYEVLCYCNACMTEWSVEPELNYPSEAYWKGANKSAPIPVIDPEETWCPFCGSSDVEVNR